MTINSHLLVYGCGGHGRSVADILIANEPDISLCFIDDHARENEHLYGFPVLNVWNGSEIQYFLAIGDNVKRANKLEQMDVELLVSVISKTAHIGHMATIAKGVFVGNFAHIGPEAVIGINTIVNNGAIIEHEVKVGAHCHIGPSATISGRCTIGDLVFVGVGTTIKDYISVCSNVTIGAGATVVMDIKEPGVYAGCPARKIR
ncbi:NeuD/PglB/VioB family sugar acetyltransferase [Geomobilimonas luticola]|uniref:NeuD/PglB/VioB family sugar acetyltransferase n=1 Tax=Geomobilimonas luticola TaxID=1114878 RepID=A0ABS5SCC2_9BACT|nr:NeuD/PglB/VioB family sugar acetyltransferase [Geomobilimonas luticola]MBT0653023.1 NeuD/PglB/VioB family sugar acetyltransferase [Geomobilimonas luticola]